MKPAPTMKKISFKRAIAIRKEDQNCEKTNLAFDASGSEKADVESHASHLVEK